MKFIRFVNAHLDSPFRGLSFLSSKEFIDMLLKMCFMLYEDVQSAIKAIINSHFDTPKCQLTADAFAKIK